MRGFSIRYLKKVPLLLFLIKSTYARLKTIERYYKRYQSRTSRISLYRKQIDDYLNNTTNLNYEEISIKIEKEINKRTKSELKLTSKWWLLFFKFILSSKRSSDTNKCINELYNETLHLTFAQNSSSALLDLYGLLIEYGMYSIGCIIRCQIPKLVLDEGIDKKSTQNILIRYLSAAFEEGKNDAIKYSLERLIASNGNNAEFFLLDLLLDRIIFKTSNKKIYSEKYIDRNYLEIIKGKRVAIVGPAQNDLNNGKEIDAFDVIVRFNYVGEKLSAINCGSRTDISYYNSNVINFILEKKDKELSISGLKAAVYKKPVQKDLVVCKCSRKMPLPLEHLMLDNSPNALPNVLADLLLYQPLELKVFNADMQLTPKRDSSYGVMNHIDKAFWDRYYPKAAHDQYSQFNFVKNCYKNNFIKADHILKEILELEISEYMDELQNSYLSRALLDVNV